MLACRSSPVTSGPTSGEPLRRGLPVGEADELAMSAPPERTYSDACATIDAGAAERLCQKWAEVGRAILARRTKMA